MAIEQNEIKKVITVDLGNTATSLKDYKKHIDDLKGSLLQLDSASEEYEKIAKEIKAEQDKLNEVMKVGKTTTDAAEGSYNQLSQTMSELKKQWKATADEAERAELGKQILDINNQLKELDASTGNFQRNVGDYANAFEQAFDKCLDGIKSIDGPLGEIGGNIKNMIPVIKSINSTAISGLTGIKKAIAATGIGLLVVSVATLISHWKDLTDVIGISQDDIDEFKDKAINAFKNVVSGAVGVGNAIGNFLLAPIRATIEAFNGLGNIIKDVFSGNFSKIKEDAVAAFDAIKGIGQKAIDFKGNYQQGVEAADNMIAVIESRLKSKDNTEKAEEAGKKIVEATTKGIKEESFNSQKVISDTFGAMFKTALGEAIKEVSEEAKRRKGWLAEAMQEAADEASQQEFDFKYSAEWDEMSEQERADREYEIERELIEKKIALQQTYLETFIGTQEEKEAELLRLSKFEQELENASVRHNRETEKRKEKDKEIALMSSLNVAGNVFGALSDLMEDGSKEQKAFAIMETTISTLTGAIEAYKSMAGIPYVGPVLGAAAAAAVTAAGIANINKIKSTTKESSGSASVAAPQVSTPSMTQVSPLLDEQSDLNRLETSGIQGNSTNEQTIKCYVVENEITNAQNKVSVVENNATF